VVAVHGDDERPTESVYVPIDPESTRNPRVADDTVIEVMAAARSIGADNSTVLLAGQVVFNETLRFAFRNHLGQRLKKAEHPMHALVLGATHLLISENEDADDGPAAYPPPGSNAPVPQPDPGAPAPNHAVSAPPAPNPGPNGPGPGQSPPVSYRPAPGPHPPAPNIAPPGPVSGPNQGPPAAPFSYGPSDQEATVKVERGELPPPISGPPSRFTRPPDPATGNQAAVPPGHGGPEPGRNGPGAGEPRTGSEPDGDRGKGKLWNKMKDNLFGAHAVVGVAALAVTAWGAHGAGTAQAYPAAETAVAGTAAPGFRLSTATAGCVPMPRVTIEPHGRSATGDDGPDDPGHPLYARVPAAPGPGDSIRGAMPEPGQVEEPDRAECAEPGIDTLRYLVPGLPGIADPGPPIDI
ncbi:MAG: hypothetical protein HOQ36_15480, partial [Nocardia sp.]|nr:hypothetical protein [Nocardia sp.]